MKKTLIIPICFLLTLLAASCAAPPAASGSGESGDTGIPSGIEVVRVATDMTVFDDLKEIEDYSTVIVEAVARKNLGQEVTTSYDYGLKKYLTGAGFTKWEIEVTKVYKGDVKTGDMLPLLLQYYIWTTEDGKKQLITGSYLKPAVKDKKYLVFLIYDDRNKGYWPVCDYEGMFAVPTDDMKAKAKAGTLSQSDFDVYDGETLHYLIPIYREVADKYFS